MLSAGLCSISFRDLPVDRVIELSVKAGLDGIEWGGDTHVPAGELELAETVRRKTEDVGLAVASYGSYCRFTAGSDEFSDCLDTARALGAPVLRVWAGSQASSETGPEARSELEERIRRSVITAAESDITVALEYHGDSLTDTAESAHRLLRAVDRPELKLYWQPRVDQPMAANLDELEAALPYLAHVHVFHWGPGGIAQRQPLLDGAPIWKRYLEKVHQADGDRYCLLEFVVGDSPDQLREDAQVLRQLVKPPAAG